MRFTVLLIISVFISIKVEAQMKGYGVEPFGGMHYAANVIYKTGANMNGYCGGIDLKFFPNQKRPNLFNDQYHNPDFSLNIRLCKLNNTDTFGFSIAIFPQIDIPIKKNSNYCLSAKIGYGLNFNTEQYDFHKNFDNRAIVSPLNFALDAGLILNYRLNSSNEIGISGGLYHVSNGSLKMPNGGINAVYTGLSYRHHFEKYLDFKYKPIIKNKAYESKFIYTIYLASGYREIAYFTSTKSFWVGSLNQQFTRKISRLYQLGITSDIFYDASPAIWENSLRSLISIQTREKLHAGLGFYQQFDIGRFFLPFSANFYLTKVSRPFYIKFGLGYQLSPKWRIGSFFKGGIKNGSKLDSDFMEWSLGYSINR